MMETVVVFPAIRSDEANVLPGISPETNASHGSQFPIAFRNTFHFKHG